MAAQMIGNFNLSSNEGNLMVNRFDIEGARLEDIEETWTCTGS